MLNDEEKEDSDAFLPEEEDREFEGEGSLPPEDLADLTESVGEDTDAE